MHSTRSDGRLSPQEVLRRCALGGLDVISLTDHDVPPALPWGRQRIAGRSIRVVHGVELTTMHEGTEQHLLVYFRRELPEAFAGFCRELVIARADRYDEAVRRAGLEGLALADASARRGERALTRTHLAQAIVEAGHASTMQEAFDRWVGERAGIVPAVKISLTDAIRHAADAGGVTSWAHPGIAASTAWTRDLARAGLRALEVYRPGFGRGKRDHLLSLAHRHRLGTTGGSDYHGWRPGELGAFSMSGRKSGALGRKLGLAA